MCAKTAACHTIASRDGPASATLQVFEIRTRLEAIVGRRTTQASQSDPWVFFDIREESDTNRNSLRLTFCAMAPAVMRCSNWEPSAALERAAMP